MFARVAAATREIPHILDIPPNAINQGATLLNEQEFAVGIYYDCTGAVPGVAPAFAMSLSGPKTKKCTALLGNFEQRIGMQVYHFLSINVLGLGVFGFGPSKSYLTKRSNLIVSKIMVFVKRGMVGDSER